MATDRFKKEPEFDHNTNFGHFLRTYRDRFLRLGPRISESEPRIPESGPRFPHNENLIANLATEEFKRQPDFDPDSNFGHFLRTYRDPGWTPRGPRISESGARIPESGLSLSNDENIIIDFAAEKFKKQPEFDHNTNFGHFLRTYRDPGFLRTARGWAPKGSRISESGPRIPKSGPSLLHDENLIADLAAEKFKRQQDFDHNSNFGHFLRTYRDPGFLRMARGWTWPTLLNKFHYKI